MKKPVGRNAFRLALISLLSFLSTDFVVKARGSRSIPALIIFGDSTVDAGTNNYLVTVVKCNFRPYGRDQSQLAFGRFSNGFTAPDYIAQNLGLPYPLPYLNPEAKGTTILQGINFASGASGWIDSTAELLNVRSMTQQGKDFKEYKSKLVDLAGESRASEIVRESLYIVSLGANDYLNNFFINPVERQRYNLSEWRDHATTSAASFFRNLYNMGGRKFIVASLPAIGCLPVTRTLYGDGKDGCVDSFNDLALQANFALHSVLMDIERDLPEARFMELDIYNPLLQAFQNPSAHGFEETSKGCCGSGKIEVAIVCNADSPGTCEDASKYLFFDSYHTSQRFDHQIANSALELLQHLDKIKH